MIARSSSFTRQIVGSGSTAFLRLAIHGSFLNTGHDYSKKPSFEIVS